MEIDREIASGLAKTVQELPNSGFNFQFFGNKAILAMQGDPITRSCLVSLLS